MLKVGVPVLEVCSLKPSSRSVRPVDPRPPGCGCRPGPQPVDEELRSSVTARRPWTSRIRIPARRGTGSGPRSGSTCSPRTSVVMNEVLADVRRRDRIDERLSDAPVGGAVSVLTRSAAKRRRPVDGVPGVAGPRGRIRDRAVLGGGRGARDAGDARAAARPLERVFIGSVAPAMTVPARTAQRYPRLPPWHWGNSVTKHLDVVPACHDAVALDRRAGDSLRVARAGVEEVAMEGADHESSFSRGPVWIWPPACGQRESTAKTSPSTFARTSGWWTRTFADVGSPGRCPGTIVGPARTVRQRFPPPRRFRNPAIRGDGASTAPQAPRAGPASRHATGSPGSRRPHAAPGDSGPRELEPPRPRQARRRERVRSCRHPPAVTCSAQATMLTGTLPTEHGAVGNGWRDPRTFEVALWRLSTMLVGGREDLRGLRCCRDASFTLREAVLVVERPAVDLSITPRPVRLPN